MAGRLLIAVDGAANGAAIAAQFGLPFPSTGVVACFPIRMAGLRYDLSPPAASEISETVDPRRRRGRKPGSD
jgi:hypothetical protein